MAQSSFALMTARGRSKEAAALANASTIEITHIAIGDGATVPSGGETALYHEVARKTISGHGTVVGASNVAYFDAFLAADEGPFLIREAGLYDSEGDLIAIAHYNPPINKPVPASGQTVEGTIRLEIAFSDVAAVTIKIDPSFRVALQRLTRLPWVPVLSISMAAPPPSPAIGDVYIIGTAPTGAWAGQPGKLAEYTTAGWSIINPPDGHGVSLPDGRVYERIAGTYVQKIARDVQSGQWLFSGDTSLAANHVIAVPEPAVPALVPGLTLRIKARNSNTGRATLEVYGHPSKEVVRRDGSMLRDSDIVAGAVQDYVYDGAKFQLTTAFGRSGLVRNLDLYVNAALGNDSNDASANIAGRAVATIQRAMDIAFGYPPSQFTITIHVADGTYGPVQTPSYGGPNIVIDGNAINPANVLVLVAAGARHCLQVSGPNTVLARNLKVENNGDPAMGCGFVASNGGQITTRNTVSGNIANAIFEGFGGGQVNIADRHVIAGNYKVALFAMFGGQVQLANGINLHAEIAATMAAFAQATAGAGVYLNNPNANFTGPNPAGKRFAAVLGGIISVNGGGDNVFPGTIAGTTATGGQYA